MTKRKHWSERKTVPLYSLKPGDKFYMLGDPSFLPYEVIEQPTGNGLMTKCIAPSGRKNFYYCTLNVVKEKLTDINPDI